MRLLCILALSVVVGSGAIQAQSATDTAKPSMNPDASGEKKTDPFGVAILSKDRPKDAKTEITARSSATFDNATNTAEFEGNVVVVDPQFTLFCDKLKVVMNKDRKGLALVEAYGKVIIKQDNKDKDGNSQVSIGRGEKLVYEPDSGNVTITIWPSLQRGRSSQVATEQGTIMILNRDGNLTTKGGSKMVIDDSEQSTGR